MSIDDDRLMAFADGELPAAERAEIEAALAQDETLREKLAAHRRLRARLSGAFDGALEEPVPERLRAAAGAAGPAKVVNLAEHKAARQRWSAREWGAMAASVAAGLLIGVGVMNAHAPLIAATDDGLVARGALANALDEQLASDEAGLVRIGLSFRAIDGGYCRTFDLVRRDTAGLACRSGDGWRIALTATHASGGEVRMAGGAEEVLAAVDARIAGEPLDAERERQARDAGWQ
ncbi:MAG: anti-sigma factor [Hyphomonadaceae bacterium]